MFAALEVHMWNLRLPEDFSTTLLSMLFAMLREKGSRATVLNLQVMLPDGPEFLKAVFPMSDETEVWMCRDLWSIWDGGRGATEEDKNLFRQKKPDVWCEDEGHILFIENKTGGGRDRENQERLYLRFLREKFHDKKKGFFYAIPEKWNAQAKGEWQDFIAERDESVVRGLLRWDSTLEDLLVRTFHVPQWFRNKLPSRMGA